MRSTKDTEKLLSTLNENYPFIDTFLDHKNAFELLIAVILSAQTTDLMVNKVTPTLFEKFPDAKSLMNANVEEVEILIKRINYYRTKAKSIIKTAEMIKIDFGGEIPATIEELIRLPGVGRKVANVIMAEIHKIPAGIVVDTHVKRVSYRIGWTNNIDPEKVEKDLIEQIPQDQWLALPRQLITIGRSFCTSRNPNCLECPLRIECLKRIEVPQKIKK